jgi:hypothetical protein
MDGNISFFKISGFNSVMLLLLDYVKGWSEDISGYGLDSWSSVLNRDRDFPPLLL